MEMRAALKMIRQHIDAKEFKKASDIVEDLLKQDVSNYLLFIFAAVANGEVGNDCEAISYYKKAAELDPEKPLAWQGLYKLYEQGKYVDLEHVLIVIRNLLRIPGMTPEKTCAYEKELGFVLLKLEKFDEVFSNPDRLDDAEFCYEALKVVLSTDNSNGDQKKLIEQCLTRIDNDKVDCKIHKKCAVLRCSWAKTLMEVRNALSWHAKYISSDDEWLTDILRYFVIISYLELRQVDPSNDVVDMLKNAVREETEFEHLLGYIEKEEMSLSIKNIDENLRNDRPYIGLAIPLLLFQERYEEVLSLLDITIPHIHPAITKTLNIKIFCAKCEALYGIHDDNALAQLCVLLTDSPDKAKSIAENAAKANPKSWKWLLVLGEICLKLSAEDALTTSALVKAAKLNPYSSKAFFFLGLCLKTKNRIKAIACLKRAAKIRPRDAKVIKLLDELLSLENLNEELYKHILQYSKIVPKDLWARKRLALLELQSGNIDAAIDQMQHVIALDKTDARIWTALGDAYKKRGNYQSAIKAFKEAIDLESDNEIAQIQFIQMCQVTGQLEEAIEQCLELMKRVESGESSTNVVSLLYAESILKLAQKSSYSLRFNLLNKFFGLIEKVFDRNLGFISPFKFASDALLLASRYHADTFQHFEFPEAWKIGSVLDAIELAVRFCCVTVKTHPKWASAWNDLGVVLLRKCQLTENNFSCSNLVECFKRAIKLCLSKTTKSMYWTNLSEAVGLSGNALMVQHCLIRALQLNIRNDTAWFLLGLLYLKFNQCDLARQTLNMAQKINPESAEIWCVLATMAEAENHHDTMDLYRHSLTLRPTELAVKKYTYYLMKNLAEGKQSDDATMFNFESIHEIIGVSKRTDEFIFFISLLAEHFWYMDYAMHYIICCHDWPNEDIFKLHKQRIAVRSGSQHLLEKTGAIQNLSTLYSSTTFEIYEKLLLECPIYAQLFSSLERNDVEHFRVISMDLKNKIQIPLFVAAVLYFRKEVSDDFINVLRDVRPRHQIILVYPVCKQNGEADEFSYNINDELGEKTIVRYDNMSKRLCDLLALRVEQYRVANITKAIPEIDEGV
uniref:TPR_REGION domain-containing protein n=1 Tax=Elaeophora elaphi TaxID=1147741 RepID=A0A0R3RIG2_9BILA